MKAVYQIERLIYLRRFWGPGACSCAAGRGESTALKFRH